jgi:hypothetical protein
MSMEFDLIPDLYLGTSSEMDKGPIWTPQI